MFVAATEVTEALRLRCLRCCGAFGGTGGGAGPMDAEKLEEVVRGGMAAGAPVKGPAITPVCCCWQGRL